MNSLSIKILIVLHLSAALFAGRAFNESQVPPEVKALYENALEKFSHVHESTYPTSAGAFLVYGDSYEDCEVLFGQRIEVDWSTRQENFQSDDHLSFANPHGKVFFEDPHGWGLLDRNIFETALRKTLSEVFNIYYVNGEFSAAQAPHDYHIDAAIKFLRSLTVATYTIGLSVSPNFIFKIDHETRQALDLYRKNFVGLVSERLISWKDKQAQTPPDFKKLKWMRWENILHMVNHPNTEESLKTFKIYQHTADCIVSASLFEEERVFNLRS